MFTVCPKCTLTLAVTADDLRIGQGYVRCGRCANVFNALLALSEEPIERATALPPPAPPPLATVALRTGTISRRTRAPLPRSRATRSRRRCAAAPAVPRRSSAAIAELGGEPHAAPARRTAHLRCRDAVPRPCRARTQWRSRRARSRWGDRESNPTTCRRHRHLRDHRARGRRDHADRGVRARRHCAVVTPSIAARRASDAAARAFVARSRAAVPARRRCSDAAADDRAPEEAAAEEALSDDGRAGRRRSRRCCSRARQPRRAGSGSPVVRRCSRLLLVAAGRSITGAMRSPPSPFWSAPLARAYARARRAARSALGPERLRRSPAGRHERSGDSQRHPRAPEPRQSCRARPAGAAAAPDAARSLRQAASRRAI